ncbi:hypothetical protein ACSBR2_019113 [Camellia fascicularis]
MRQKKKVGHSRHLLLQLLGMWTEGYSPQSTTKTQKVFLIFCAFSELQCHSLTSILSKISKNQIPATESLLVQHYIPMLFHLILFFFLLSSVNVVSHSALVKTLPGFSGNLSFKLETGYVGVGESDEVQLFYYFIESERSPKDDPLMLWLTGGPGCSALSALLYEIGPFTFDYETSTWNKPTLKLNPYSWTKVVNIIFLDSPVGTGFSYAKTSAAYNTSDTLAAGQAYSFLRKWIVDHPEFLDNPLYIGGDSYSGLIVPNVVQEIYDGNEVGNEPPLNIEGYLLGNPFTHEINDLNSRVPFAHRVVYLSNSLYESTKAYCYGKYRDVDPDNVLCVEYLQQVQECVEKINMPQILEPLCGTLSPKPHFLKWDRNALVEEIPKNLSLPTIPGPWCRNYNYIYSYVWANDETVRKALHVREGTKEEWQRCNKTLSMTNDVVNSVNFHKNLTTRRCRALVYSGDHDMVIPYMGTLEWINVLDLPIVYGWKPWFLHGEVSGFTERYTNNLYSLTFATVKGAGHTAPEYMPKDCFAMISRWFSNFPL